MMEVELGGTRYRGGRLDAFKQYHVFRKLLPVLAGMGATYVEMNEGEDIDIFANPKFWMSLGPAANAMAEMSQGDSEFVLKTCLAVVQRWNGQQWVRICAANGELMFEDIDMMQMLQLGFEVMKDNLGSFFGAPLPNGSGDGAQVLTYPSPQ
jgi:hypothetical protein